MKTKLVFSAVLLALGLVLMGCPSSTVTTEDSSYVLRNC
jgi:hypothetical protein